VRGHVSQVLPPGPFGLAVTRPRRCQPPHAGVRALRGAAAAALLPDHATGGTGRTGAVVVVRDGELDPAPFRVDGVAGAVGDHDLDHAGAGVQRVVLEADVCAEPAAVTPDVHGVAGPDLAVLRGGSEFNRGPTIAKPVRAGESEGEHPNGRAIEKSWVGIGIIDNTVALSYKPVAGQLRVLEGSE